jgi:hypothetical protein
MIKIKFIDLQKYGYREWPTVSKTGENMLGDFYGWFTKFTAKQHLNLLSQKYFQAKLHETNKI